MLSVVYLYTPPTLLLFISQIQMQHIIINHTLRTWDIYHPLMLFTQVLAEHKWSSKDTIEEKKYICDMSFADLKTFFTDKLSYTFANMTPIDEDGVPLERCICASYSCIGDCGLMDCGACIDTCRCRTSRSGSE